MAKQRARELGVICGRMTPGCFNAITDVPGVKVGHTTLSDRGIQTGVTAIVPHSGNMFQEKLVASAHVINGFGKSIGLAQITELGQLETPILLTGTLSAAKTADALISWMLCRDSSITSLNPVVGECNDSYLSDIRSRPIQEEHVFSALERASEGVVAEGAVGAGRGMTAFGFKGGIGTASRCLDAAQGGFTVGMLVLANFGSPSELLISGVPVGQMLQQNRDPGNNLGDGSIMMILACDAPLSSRQLSRLARRAAFGLARTGSVASHGSGDFVLAFSTAERLPAKRPEGVFTRMAPRLYEDGALLTPLFQAVAEATEEAILNALFAAETTVGYQDHARQALPVPDVLEILRQHHRLA